MIINELVVFIAEKCQMEPERITIDTRLDELGIDSMQAIVLFYDLEEHFDIDIPNEMFESAKTVGDVVEQIQQLKNPEGDACPGA